MKKREKIGRKMKKRGVILDFDGVLGDTEGLQYKKWNILLEPFGIEIGKKEYVRDYCGKSSATEIPLLLKKKYGDKIPYTLEEMAQLATEILANLFTRPIEFMPGAKDALHFFKQKGLKMAVCSAKNPEELEMKLRGAKLLDWFPPEVRSTQAEAGGLAKPHPAMYRLACRRLGLLPRECLAFEDTSVGVKSAHEAGLYVIALPNEWSAEQNFNCADRVVLGGWPGFLAYRYPL
jgi:beta-phosphoglucomutase-like phosphatase (HAD superfamily)